MKKVAAIIQARVGSTRLPNKSIALIQGKPLIWHVIERAKYCLKVSEVVVATSISPEDQQIADIADMCGAAVFRGSETDVLSRYCFAAQEAAADVVVRMTGDCPLIHPPTVDRMIALLLNQEVDYVCADPRFPSLETGLEVLTFSALDKAFEKSAQDYQKEHVTLYIREHPEEFLLALYTSEPQFRRDDIRITVDYPEDLALIRKMYELFFREGEIVDLHKVVAYLDQHPNLRKSNINVKLSRANQLSASDQISQRIIKRVLNQ